MPPLIQVPFFPMISGRMLSESGAPAARRSAVTASRPLRGPRPSSAAAARSKRSASGCGVSSTASWESRGRSTVRHSEGGWARSCSSARVFSAYSAAATCLQSRETGQVQREPAGRHTPPAVGRQKRRETASASYSRSSTTTR